MVVIFIAKYWNNLLIAAFMLCCCGNRRLTDLLVAFLQPLQRLQAYVLLFGLRRLLFIKSHQKMGFKATQ